MQYGVCALSVIPMRSEPADAAEMVNQVLFGECFEILDKQKKWSYIKLAHDSYEGWVDNKQIEPCSEKQFAKASTSKPMLSQELVDIVSNNKTAEFFPVFLGSILPSYKADGSIQVGDQAFSFTGSASIGEKSRENLIEHAYKYLNAPYLWGGRNPFGIDCSGFTQMVYRFGGYSIPRDSGEQAKLGDTLSFIEESEPGDLAFFDNAEGRIVHVGIILENNYILHASGKVRLDRLDQTGIFNNDIGSHTHQLRVIKKII